MTWMRTLGVSLLVAAVFAAAAMAGDVVLPEGALLRPLVAAGKAPKIEAGAVLRGEFANAVYGGAVRAIPAGSRIELTLGEIPKQQGQAWWTHVTRLLAGRPIAKRAVRPASVATAELTLPGGGKRALAVRLLDAQPHAPVRQQKNAGEKREKRLAMVLELTAPLRLPAEIAQAEAGAATIPSGTKARAMLLDAVRSSSNREGDGLRVRLLEPVMVDGKVALAEGTMVEASVMRSQGPRWLRRPGKLGMSFRKLTMGEGRVQEVSASLSGAESSEAGLRMDAEGTISGGPASTKRLLLDVGMGYVTGKIVDDLIEEGVKGIWTTVSPGTVANYARWFGIGAGVALFLSQPGRDVYLPQYAEVELTFNRAVKLGSR